MIEELAVQSRNKVDLALGTNIGIKEVAVKCRNKSN